MRTSLYYNFFLNPYKDTRFTTCPQCRAKTLQRKHTLVIQVQQAETLLWDKLCRYCGHCDLLILHKDKLEELLVEYFTITNPRVIGNDYRVLGTAERSASKQAQMSTLSINEMLEQMHDFKEIVSFQRVLM